MKENPVHVSWPCRLKIGAKTRKGEFFLNFLIRLGSVNYCYPFVISWNFFHFTFDN